MRPRLLDLFCCAGGGAKGYHRAGFDVVGVDHRPQPRYPYAFVQADALEYLTRHSHEFDVIHASPPCQAHCALKHLAKTKKHPDLIASTRYLLELTGLPYVIENVPGAPLIDPAMLCGTMFGLRTDCGAELRRHRLFETNWPLRVDLECNHYGSRTEDGPCTEIVHGHSGGRSSRDSTTSRVISITGHTPESRKGSSAQGKRRVISVNGDHPRAGNDSHQRLCGSTITVAGSTAKHEIGTNRTLRKGGVESRPVVRKLFSVDDARVAMGIDWMPMKDLSQAIPPSYTFYLGTQWIQWLLTARERAA